MNIDNASKENLMWMVIVHMTFVVSGVLLALMDRLEGDHHGAKVKAAAAGKPDHH